MNMLSSRLVKSWNAWWQMGSTLKEHHGLGSRYRPFILAALNVTVATLVRGLLDPILGDDHPFVVYYAALAATAWYGGWWPAMLTLILSYLAADWFFMLPKYELTIASLKPSSLAACGMFVSTGLLVAAFSEA